MGDAQHLRQIEQQRRRGVRFTELGQGFPDEGFRPLELLRPDIDNRQVDHHGDRPVRLSFEEGFGFRIPALFDKNLTDVRLSGLVGWLTGRRQLQHATVFLKRGSGLTGLYIRVTEIQVPSGFVG